MVPNDARIIAISQTSFQAPSRALNELASESSVNNHDIQDDPTVDETTCNRKMQDLNEAPGEQGEIVLALATQHAPDNIEVMLPNEEMQPQPLMVDDHVIVQEQEINHVQGDDGLMLALPAHEDIDNQDNLNAPLPNDLLQEIDNLGNTNSNSHLPGSSLNLQIGFMVHQESRVVDPVFEKFTIHDVNVIPLKTKNVDLLRLWGRLFSPLGDLDRQISITFIWAPLFTTRLLRKDSFY
jgi:hypothetical protein